MWNLLNTWRDATSWKIPHLISCDGVTVSSGIQFIFFKGRRDSGLWLQWEVMMSRMVTLKDSMDWMIYDLPFACSKKIYPQSLSVKWKRWILKNFLTLIMRLLLFIHRLVVEQQKWSWIRVVVVVVILGGAIDIKSSTLSLLVLQIQQQNLDLPKKKLISRMPFWLPRDLK